MKTTILLDCNNQALHKYIEQSFDYDFRNDTAGHNDYDILLKQRKIVSRQHRTRYKFHDFNTNLGRVMGMVEALLTLTNTYSYRQDEAALATKGVYAISAAQDGTNNLYFLQSWCNADLDFNRSTSLTVKFSYRSQHNTVLMSFWYGSRKLSATFFQPTISSIDFFASVLHQNSIEMHRAWVAPRMHYFANHVLSKIDLGEQTYYIIDGDTQTLGIKKNNVRYIIGRLRQVTLPPDIAATS